MINCPACRQLAFNYKQKMLLGPLSHLECPSCGAAVTVTRAAFAVWILAAFFGLVQPTILGMLGMGIGGRVALFVVSYALAVFLHLKCVPLAAKRTA
jgi:hypothetical protein